MPDKDPQSGRVLENILYGTPTYPGSSTPDGRIVNELRSTRAGTDRHSEQVLALQRETVHALQSLHGGKNVVSRRDYLVAESETRQVLQDAASQMAGIQLGQRELLAENRVLNQIASQGFGYVGQALDDVKSGVKEVSRAVTDGTRTLHGPSFPQEDVAEFSRRRRDFFEVLGAQQKGMLSEKAESELFQCIDSQFASNEARVAVDEFLSKHLHGEQESLIEELRRRSRIVEHPSELLGSNSSTGLENLTMIERIAERFPCEALDCFIQNAKGLIRLSHRAVKSGLSEELVVDLTKHGLASDLVQHQVKRRCREARVTGTDVDRNYNLMELLGQGDRRLQQGETGLRQGAHLIRQGDANLAQGQFAQWQRGRLVTLGEAQTTGISELVEQGDAGLAQRDRLIELGERQIGTQVVFGVETQRRLGVLADIGRLSNVYLETLADQGAALISQGQVGNRYLGDIATSLVGANSHLVNLEQLGVRFIQTMEYGFGQVTGTLMDGFAEVTGVLADGFAVQEQRLVEIAFEMASTRAELSGRLASLEGTIWDLGDHIQRETARTNTLLTQMIDLTAHPLRTRAREKFDQGLTVLSRAKKKKSVDEARRLFQSTIEDDTTIMEAHYGVAVAAELLGDGGSASEEYERVGEESPDEKSKLASAGWQGHARLRENAGDIPTSISSLRNALERDDENQTTKWMLARALALAGLNEESMETLLVLVADEPNYIYQIAREQAFDVFSLGDFYKSILKSVRDSAIRFYLVSEFTRLGDEQMAFGIIQDFCKYNPACLLENHDRLESPYLIKLKEALKEHLKAVIEKNNSYSAEGWYAITFVAICFDLGETLVLMAFRKGLMQDMDFHNCDNTKIIKKLNAIDPSSLSKLRGIVSSSVMDFGWIFL